MVLDGKNRLWQICLSVICFLVLLTGCATEQDKEQGRKKVSEEQQAEVQFFAMDTYITFSAYGENAQEYLQQAQAQILQLEKKWSVTEADSDIYKVNHSSGKSVAVSEETKELLSFALQMAEKTDGALEPTIYPVLSAWGFTTDKKRVPEKSEIVQLLEKVDFRKISLEGNEIRLEPGMMLDIGAVGKGYAGDTVIGLLKEKGITSALLDLGGNIQTIGKKPDGSDWQIGLQDPESDGSLGVLSISDRAVVTSGNYERYFTGEDGKIYGHIINPETGYPAESGLLSVTVIAQEGKLCDALSTSLFVMGLDRAVNYWREHQNFEMILITEDGEIHLTEGIKDQFVLESDYSGREINVILQEDGG